MVLVILHIKLFETFPNKIKTPDNISLLKNIKTILYLCKITRREFAAKCHVLSVFRVNPILTVV